MFFIYLNVRTNIRKLFESVLKMCNYFYFFRNLPLCSESQRLLLFGGEVEVFGHFVQERGSFDAREIEDSEGIDPVVE